MEKEGHHTIKINSLLRNIVNDEYRYYFQLLYMSMLMGLISFGMGVMNIITHKTVLMIATLSFAFVSGMNALLLALTKKARSYNYAIFALSVVILFVYFLISGGTAGFSPHWILLLPTCGMLFLGQKRGLILSFVMLGIIIACLWTPIRNYIYPFTPEFCMRFPVVYGAFLAVGFASEFLRGLTYRLMEESQEKLAEAAIRDELTGLHNRRWFNERISEEYDKRELRSDGVFVLCDIDNFKSINDTYGHTNGDGALIHIAQQLQNNIRGSDLLCRWGGEEFLLFLSDCAADHAFETCDRLRQAVEQSVFVTEEGSELSVTISLGAVVLKKGEVLDSGRVFSVIDEYLYLAKDKGKNRVEMGASPISPLS